MSWACGKVTAGLIPGNQDIRHQADILNLCIFLYLFLIISWFCLLYSNSGLLLCMGFDGHMMKVDHAAVPVRDLMPDSREKGLNWHGVDRYPPHALPDMPDVLTWCKCSCTCGEFLKKAPQLEKPCLKVSATLLWKGLFLRRTGVF